MKETKLKEIEQLKKNINNQTNKKIILFKEKQIVNQKLQDLKGKIRVIIRIRPHNKTNTHNYDIKHLNIELKSINTLKEKNAENEKSFIYLKPKNKYGIYQELV